MKVELQSENTAWKTLSVIMILFMGSVVCTWSDEPGAGIPRDNLVLYFPFEGEANDASGNGNHGTIHGAVPAEDRFGNRAGAYRFDGINDWIEVEDNSTLRLTNAFTLAAWFKVPSPYPENHSALLGKGRSAKGSGYNMLINPGARGIVAGVNDGSANYGVKTIDPLSPEKWHFASISYDGMLLRFYIDGELKDSKRAAFSLQKSAQPLNIGKELTGSLSRYFTGVIDDVYIYNRALREDEIQYLGQIPEIIKVETANFNFYSNDENRGFPSINEKAGILTLTPRDTYSAAGVAFLKKKFPLPFEISFEFNIWDKDGGPMKIWNSANGICLMLGKDETLYSNEDPPAGSGMGFITDAGGTGIGLFYETYGNRQVTFKDDRGQVFASVSDPRIYTDGAWQKTTIRVTEESIDLFFDNDLIKHWDGKVDFDRNTVAFSAATGGADSRHQVRKIVISPLPKVSSGLPELPGKSALYRETGESLYQRLSLNYALSDGRTVHLLVLDEETPLYIDTIDFQRSRHLSQYEILDLIEAPNNVYTDSTGRIELFYKVRLPETGAEGWVQASRTAYRFDSAGNTHFIVREIPTRAHPGIRTIDSAEVREDGITVIVTDPADYRFLSRIEEIDLVEDTKNGVLSLSMSYPGDASEVRFVNTLTIKRFDMVLTEVRSRIDQNIFALAYPYTDHQVMLKTDAETPGDIIPDVHWTEESTVIMPDDFSYGEDEDDMGLDVKNDFYDSQEDLWQQEMELFIVDQIDFIPVKGTCNDSRVRIRVKPDLKAAQLGYLEKDDKVVILERTEKKMMIGDMNDYWYRFRLEKRAAGMETEKLEGWSYGEFIDPEPLYIRWMLRGDSDSKIVYLMFGDPESLWGLMQLGDKGYEYYTEGRFSHEASPEIDLENGGFLRFEDEAERLKVTVEDDELGLWIQYKPQQGWSGIVFPIPGNTVVFPREAEYYPKQ
jgi:hypothetical protein